MRLTPTLYSRIFGTRRLCAAHGQNITLCAFAATHQRLCLYNAKQIHRTKVDRTEQTDEEMEACMKALSSVGQDSCAAVLE